MYKTRLSFSMHVVQESDLDRKQRSSGSSVSISEQKTTSIVPRAASRKSLVLYRNRPKVTVILKLKMHSQSAGESVSRRKDQTAMVSLEQGNPGAHCSFAADRFQELKVNQDSLSDALLDCKIHNEHSSHYSVTQTAPASDVVQHPLFRLPCELRQMIFGWSIEFSRSPSPYLVHSTFLPRTWKDRPSPLLSTNRQIRNEVIDLIRSNKIFTLRLTTFGAAFDMLSLSSFIAQGLPKSYFGLPELRIEIWPPHDDPERQVEMLYLHESLKRLRDELRNGPQLHHLSAHFLENSQVKWTSDGFPPENLCYFDSKRGDDMEIMLDHLAFITNVDKATVQLPLSLAQNKNMNTHLFFVLERMEGRDLEDGYWDFYSDFTEDFLEYPFGDEDVRSVEERFFWHMKWNQERIRESKYQDYNSMYRAWYTEIRDNEEDAPFYVSKHHLDEFYYDEDDYNDYALF